MQSSDVGSELTSSVRVAHLMFVCNTHWCDCTIDRLYHRDRDRDRDRRQLEDDMILTVNHILLYLEESDKLSNRM